MTEDDKALVMEARLDAKAFRENTVYDSEGDPLRLIANADRLDAYAERIKAQAAEIEHLRETLENTVETKLCCATCKWFTPNKIREVPAEPPTHTRFLGVNWANNGFDAHCERLARTYILENNASGKCHYEPRAVEKWRASFCSRHTPAQSLDGGAKAERDLIAAWLRKIGKRQLAEAIEAEEHWG